MNQHAPMIDAKDIDAQAKQIRRIVDEVIKACEQGKPIDAYTRNKIMGGSLAQEAAVLSVYLTQYYAEHEG